MQGVRAENVVVRESDLTRRVGEDAEVAVESFVESELREGAHASVMIKTSERSEARAKTLLGLVEAAFVRMLGGAEDADVELKILTHQAFSSASIKLSHGFVDRTARSIGIAAIDERDLEEFLMKRIVTEYVFLSEPFHFLKIPLPFLESAR